MKDQNPDVSAEKMNTFPESRIRMPRHTSAPHLLLYSCDFLSRDILRRSVFCRNDFLVTLEVFDGPLEFLVIMTEWYGEL